MRILWVKSDFLHPTQRGGQIRTLEILRRLHRSHEVHYVAFGDPKHPEAPDQARATYCTEAYPVNASIPARSSPAFMLQALGNLFDPLPLSIARYCSRQMRETIAEVRGRHHFDSIVCDFLTMAPNFPDLENCVLFQHNVEHVIWKRHAEHAADPLRRAYFHLQYRRTFDCERSACRKAARIIVVSDVDRDQMSSLFDVNRISVVPTGVDVDYFRSGGESAPSSDLVFVGAMDWMPNIDGMLFFVSEVLPLIRKRHPRCTLTIAGRAPVASVLNLAKADPLISVTGTVPDVRPYLWGAKASIVPLRIGGGTRLKIYESMAAGTPVVSTRVGAEGLSVSDGDDLLFADSPAEFADQCCRLLEDRALAARLRAGGLSRADEFSWDSIAHRFEQALLAGAADRLGTSMKERR